MSSKKLKSELLFPSTLSESPYSTKYNSNRESTMRGSLPRKAMLSYCILGILSAFSHSAIAHGPEKITPIENDEQVLTGVPDPNTRNANQEGLRGMLNSHPSGVADGSLTGQRTNSPAPATAATSGENAAVLPSPPAAASPTVAAGSSKATSVTTTEPVAAHKESAAVPPTHAIDTISPAAQAENLMAPPAATPAPATAAVIKDPSSASDAESDNEKSQDKRRSKKKKKLKQAALNHAKGTGHT
ncbi:hypothetical protein [Sodalis praecaptivus]|uniref:hypothetical protein n=1 Tax=Sodalis praecaptivus TaxID=1239307 RepID=UPI00280BDBCC|nr:hypothetical protein [Sodalis praecaptivus]